MQEELEQVEGEAIGGLEAEVKQLRARLEDEARRGKRQARQSGRQARQKLERKLEIFTSKSL